MDPPVTREVMSFDVLKVMSPSAEFISTSPVLIITLTRLVLPTRSGDSGEATKIVCA